MSSEARRPGRRAPLPPLPMPHELPRAQLVDVLERRFDVAVASVVAGAGFGKTTALAQAIRANDAHPRGIDRWVACEPGDEEDVRLAAAITGTPGTGPPLADVLAALATWAPMDVCVFIDDVHELPAGSPGERLLVELVANLPPHAHLVLASRRPLPVPLSRLRAAGRVVDLGEDDLVFTLDEAATLSRLRGGDAELAGQLGGWPSLVQLQLSAPPGAASQFLWEEIVDGLSGPVRDGLHALSALGSGTPADVARVAGGELDTAELIAEVVPLVWRDADDRLHAHQLWQDAVGRIFPADERAALRGRALELFAERGETLRLGWSALRWGDDDALRRATRALARDTLGALPVQTAGRWLAEAPAASSMAPELRLLDLAVRQAQHTIGPDADRDIDELIARFADADDGEGVAIAVSIGAVIAHGRGDHARLHDLLDSLDADQATDEIPVLAFLRGAVAAAIASFSGDPDAVLALTGSLRYDLVSREASELIVRLHVTMLVLAGRADEAAEFADVLERSHDAHVRWLPSYVRFLAHDPSVEVDESAVPAATDEVNRRDRRFNAAQVSAVAASRGDVHTVARHLATVTETAATSDPRDASVGAVVAALSHVALHDEPTARATIAAHLERFPLTEPLCEAHMRRHIAASYLLSTAACEHWEVAELGHLHRKTVAVARLLATLRTNERPDTELPAPDVVMTSLPLVWSVELAVRSLAAEVPGASELADRLLHWEPDAVVGELEAWCHDPHDRLRPAATAILGRRPAAPSAPIRIDVLGPLRVTYDGKELDGPGLRRGRVRTLLAVLALCGPVRRDRIVDLIWPDAEASVGRRNLRVTLNRLRHALTTPDSAAPIRAEGDTVALAGPPFTDLDLHRFRERVTAAEGHRRRSETSAELDELHAAIELWRDRPLPDLDSIAGLEAEVEQVRGELIEVGLRLGEASLVAGRFGDALGCALRCREASPYDERAHRLAIAANLHREDHHGVAAAVCDLHEALDELGVSPQPATMMLLRRAGDARPQQAAPSVLERSGCQPRRSADLPTPTTLKRTVC